MGESRRCLSLLPLSGGFFRANFRQMVRGGESKIVLIPILFFLIRHPKGNILFDAGLGEDFHDQVRRWRGHRLAQIILPCRFEPSDAAVSQLQRLGVPSVRFILLSHLHYDHAGGVKDFPEAAVVVSRREWEGVPEGRWGARLRGVMKEPLEGIESRLRLVDYRPGTAFGPFEASFDLFGDRSLLLLSTPGHTPGHQSLLVTLASGRRVLLTGDAVWVRENYLWPAPKGWLVRHLEEKEEEAWETTLRIKRFHDENPEVLILPGHDLAEKDLLFRAMVSFGVK